MSSRSGSARSPRTSKKHSTIEWGCSPSEGQILAVRRSTGCRDRVHHHMKELRASRDGALRALFVVDPRPQVILLVGGDKRGQWEAWYRWAIPTADDLYDRYLDELIEEGLI